MQFKLPQYRIDGEALERVQRKVARMMPRLKVLAIRKRWTDWNCFFSGTLEIEGDLKEKL